ncbi:RNA polymerase sigma factor [Adhaeretor mobilis]|uniref:RNA polymerase sigma factor n=1 Tax=Adhaeretor mobilis TaxID=1930276 RepID=A0A517MS04_9BACT|nr:ECF-type sigma factor [Adhaeretor mobilis]QDS97668.1 RNA polymerase sigma factor [Adhaeretor mobilis]
MSDKHPETQLNSEAVEQALPESVSTDRSLLRRFQAGEEDAATSLYVKYAKRLEALARKQTNDQFAARFDPEDVVQSVFRTFFRRAVKSGYQVPAGEELWQLLLVLALNKIRTLATFHHAQKRDVSRTCASPNNKLWDLEAKSGEELAFRTMQLVVQDLVSSLPAPQDRIVEMRIEGHEVKEIARSVKRSLRTVERTLQHFRKELSKSIDAES